MPRRPVRESLFARSLRSPPACVAVTSLAALLAGCGAKEEPSSRRTTEAPAAAVAEGDAAPVRVASAKDAVVLTTASSTGSSSDTTETKAPSLVDRLPGTYTRESYGTRTLTVREDGTATMRVDVDPFYQWMVGSKITVQIEWELTSEADAETPAVHFESVSGTPKASFDSVTNLFGRERDWRIQTADDAVLVLHNPEDEETEVWARVGGEEDQG